MGTWYSLSTNSSTKSQWIFSSPPFPILHWECHPCTGWCAHTHGFHLCSTHHPLPSPESDSIRDVRVGKRWVENLDWLDVTTKIKNMTRHQYLERSDRMSRKNYSRFIVESTVEMYGIIVSVMSGPLGFFYIPDLLNLWTYYELQVVRSAPDPRSPLAATTCSQFVQVKEKETSKPPHYWLYVKKYIADRWVFFTKGHQCEECFPAMTSS